MKVGEFLKKHNIYLRYASDRAMMQRNSDREVLAFAVATSGKFSHSWASGHRYVENYDGSLSKAYCYGFIVKTQKAFVGYINGDRKDVAQVFEWIKHFSTHMKIEDEEKLRKELVLHNI